MSALENGLMGLDDAAALIEAGHFLMIAGDEALLRSLPAGNWMGGTIPYFMGSDGGQVSRDRLFVTRVPVDAGRPEIRSYDITSIDHVCADGPMNGFSLIIIPAFSAVHSLYAPQGAGLRGHVHQAGGGVGGGLPPGRPRPGGAAGGQRPRAGL